MRTIFSDLKRSILSWQFLAACVIGMIVTLIGAMDPILTAYENYKLYGLVQMLSEDIIVKALRSDAVLLCVPIVAAVPFTTAFLDDIKSGFIKHFLTRTRFNSYIIGKITACAVAGGLALGIGTGLGTFAIKLIAAPIEAPMYVGQEHIWKATALIPFFLSGALWPLVGMLLSAITMNKYMAYASPFIIYYVFVILAERYFRKAYVLNPQNYITMTGGWDLGATSIYITLGLLTVGIALIFYIVANYRLRN